MNTKDTAFLFLVLAISTFLSFSQAWGQAIITVNDATDLVVGDNGLVTLREAILYATGTPPGPLDSSCCITGTPGTVSADRIQFSPLLIGSTISVGMVLGPLPPLSTNNDIIDGDANGNTIPDITLDGLLTTPCLTIFSNNNVIQNLIINNCGGDGISITGANNTSQGVTITNSTNGIVITGPSSTGNRILGSFIGTNSSGATGLGNSGDGILINNGASSNIIGGPGLGEPNVIAANSGNGISIFDPGSNNNRILNNFIGTNASSSILLGNSSSGIRMAPFANSPINGTIIEGNIIGNNFFKGIFITLDGGSTGTQITNNFIGTDPTLAPNLGNSTAGIFVDNNSVVPANILIDNNKVFFTFSGGLTGIDISNLGTGNLNLTLINNQINANEETGVFIFDDEFMGGMITATIRSNIIVNQVEVFGPADGLKLSGDINVTIDSNTITDNDGNGVSLEDNNPSLANTTNLINNVIQSNGTGSFGGAGISITGFAVQGTFDRNRIEGNSSGGIFQGSDGTITIANSLIVNHPVTTGIQVVTSFGSINLVNSTISNNNIGVDASFGNVNITNSIIFGNGTDVTGSFSGSNNIINAPNPLFVPADPDFNLQLNSPARNTGNNASVIGLLDFDGDPRILGTNVDIGAQEIPAPVVSSVVPNQGLQGTTLDVDIIGANFRSGVTVNFGAGITVNSVIVTSTTLIDANITIDPLAIPGFRNVTVTDPDTQLGSLPNGFEVLPVPPPTIISVTPNQGLPGIPSLIVTISGANFQNGATVDFGAGITVNSVVFISSTQLTVDIAIDAAAPPGFRDVTVINPDTQSGTLVNGFIVLPPSSPFVSSVSPNQGVQGIPSLRVAINGMNFQDGATVSFGVGITVNTTLFVSDTLLAVDITIDIAAPLGFRDVTVTNPDNLSGSLVNAFEVLPFPCILPSPPPQPRTAIRSLPAASDFSNPQAAYAMIGSPLIPVDTNPLAILEHHFGPFALGLWRLFRYDSLSGAYVEFSPGDPTFNFSSGKGFWFISRNGGDFHIVGRRNNASAPFNIELAPGFNQVATPFNFPIDWFGPCLTRPSGVSSALFSFEGDYNPNTQILEPMEAYWVFNANSFPVTLSIPPIPALNSSQARTFVSRSVSTPSLAGSWRMKLSAVMGEAKDTNNYLGVDAESQDGLDALDYPEPPAINGLSLYFPHPGWNRWATNYTTDIRGMGNNPILIWNVEVQAELPNSQVQLSWTLEGIDGKFLRLRDIEGGQLINMGRINKHSYNTGKGGIRHFQVIAKVIPAKRGDVNADGQVNSQDALLILQVIQGLRPATDPIHAQVMEKGDVTQDGRVDQADVQRIQGCETQILSGPACDFSQ